GQPKLLRLQLRALEPYGITEQSTRPPVKRMIQQFLQFETKRTGCGERAHRSRKVLRKGGGRQQKRANTKLQRCTHGMEPFYRIIGGVMSSIRDKVLRQEGLLMKRFALGLLVVACSASAQTNVGAITGTVHDQQSAVMQNVKITVTNL